MGVGPCPAYKFEPHLAALTVRWHSGPGGDARLSLAYRATGPDVIRLPLRHHLCGDVGYSVTPTPALRRTPRVSSATAEFAHRLSRGGDRADEASG